MTKKTKSKVKRSLPDHSNSDAESISNDEISVEFEFYNMDLPDYHAVRNFLCQAFGQNYSDVIDAGKIAKVITEDFSEDVGTTIKTEGEQSDPFAFASIVPLCSGTDQESQRMLKKFFLKTCKDVQDKERLEKLLKEDKVSVLFMERFVNMPADVAPPLYKQLLHDYNNAVKEDAQFQVDYVIMSTPTYVEVESELDKELAGQGSSKGKKKAKQQAQLLQSKNQSCSYYYGESELLPQLAEWYWDYKVDKPERMSDSKRAFGDLGVVSGRRVFILSVGSFKTFVNSIEEYIK